MEQQQESRILALIHIARGLLILPIPIVVYSQFMSYRPSIPGPDIAMVSPLIPLVFLVILVIIEFYNASQLLGKKFQDLLVPLCTMFLVVMTELAFPIGLTVVDKIGLAIHISFVIGLSVVESGLIILYYVG
jgi:hypothetical protein